MQLRLIRVGATLGTEPGKVPVCPHRRVPGLMERRPVLSREAL